MKRSNTSLIENLARWKIAIDYLLNDCTIKNNNSFIGDLMIIYLCMVSC